MFTSIKTAKQIDNLRESGKILATVLQRLRGEATAGMTPKQLALSAKQELSALGGKPVFLGFHGYPDIICISVNNQVQHSIPNDRPLEAGDAVNFDFGVNYQGMITDGGIMVCIDDAFTADTKRLLTGTERALAAGIATVRDGCHVGDISAAVQAILEQYKLGIVRDLVGHGVGNELHEEPDIPNYGRAGTGPLLKAGMTIAIEPITTLGRGEIFEAPDGWTLYTRDGSWAAQIEHTVLVLDDGYEILTQLAS